MSNRSVSAQLLLGGGGGVQVMKPSHTACEHTEVVSEQQNRFLCISMRPARLCFSTCSPSVVPFKLMSYDSQDLLVAF